MPRAPAPARRRGEARCVAGRRVSARDARDVARRDVHEAEHDALPQPARHGGRRAAPREPGGRRRPARRLRQDGAGAADGRHQHGPAGGFSSGGPDAARQLVRPTAGERHRRLEVLGRVAGGPDRRARVGPDRGRHRAIRRHLYDDGHGVDDGVGDRGDGPDPAWRGMHAGGRLGPLAPGCRNRTPRGRDGVGGRTAFHASHACGVQERGDRLAGDRRIDQRRHPPRRAGGPRARATVAR